MLFMLVVILASVLFGIVLTLVVQAFFIRKYVGGLPKLETPVKEQFDKFTLPKSIKDLLDDVDLKNKKETCNSLNLLFQFIFRELKDLPPVRGWLINKMNAEFDEMLQTTTGKLMDQITVRDFNIGGHFPIAKWFSVKSATPHADNLSLDELEILVDLEYHGGFQISVDVDLVFGKSAYLSIKLSHLRGTGRLQLSRQPFTHWSFAFIDDPTIDFEVESQFEGRPMPQITSLIVNQIRRNIRKKHTLPNYKIRFKPFFIKAQPPDKVEDYFLYGRKLTIGHLDVTVTECTRLQKVSADSLVFCTLALDKLPWHELMTSRRKLWMTHDIEILKGTTPSLGLLFKEEFLLDKYEEVVIVEMVTPNSPASDADIRKNDVIVAVNGIRVTSIRQVVKLMKQGGDRFSVRVERASVNKNFGQDIMFEEDRVLLKTDSYTGDGDYDKALTDDDEFININIRPVDPERSPLPNRREFSPPKDEKSPKRFPFLSAAPALFQRRKSKDNSGATDGSPVPSPKTSPEPVRRAVPPSVDSLHRDELGQGSGRRTHSEGSIQVPTIKQETCKLGTERNNSFCSQPGELPNRLQGVDSTSSYMDEMAAVDLRRTTLVPSSLEPYWDEKFEFDVEEVHRYLNVCVWYRTPEKLDKHDRVIKPEKDLLLGHLSVPLMDIASQCAGTLQGDDQQVYCLSPPEHKGGASRSKTAIAAHPGYEDKLAHGDITLAYHFCPKPLSAVKEHPSTPEKRLEKLEPLHNFSATREELLTGYETHGKRSFGKQPEGRHDFLGTQFHSATYCHFCAKKIWLKVAFQCRICAMICHKKCTEKCQAQTICTKEGPIPKFPLPPEMGGKTDIKDIPVEKTSSGPLQKSAALLSRFTKRDSPKSGRKSSGKTLVSSAKSSPHRTSLAEEEASSTERRRHNSAPDENKLETKDDQAIPTHATLDLPMALPRTRSSTSFEGLLKDNATPSVGENFRKSDDESSSNSSEDEEELMMLQKLKEYQKGSHDKDELVVTAAKQMGKELYSHLSLEERREKLDAMVTKFQNEIDTESENRAELARMEREATDSAQKSSIRSKIKKSDEKIQALAVLMLHYCAGLQHCLDNMEEERLKMDDTGCVGGATAAM
ncbi:PDZ domain-containing protein 8-like isoform X2 [Lineus longissimus]|uniref:PDZ domain-containing protein 8-like isoform X2 n=1 Tax=Lineus longissimus TaxID=88925 RepID=UPI002B4E05EC